MDNCGEFLPVMLLTSAYREGTLEFLKTLNSAQFGTWAPCPAGGEGGGTAGSAHTIEELDDVGEVHVVLTYNLSVGLHQGQGNEQDKVLRRDVPGGPDHFPHCEHVLIQQLWGQQRASTGRILPLHTAWLARLQNSRQFYPLP